MVSFTPWLNQPRRKSPPVLSKEYKVRLDLKADLDDFGAEMYPLPLPRIEPRYLRKETFRNTVLLPTVAKYRGQCSDQANRG